MTAKFVGISLLALSLVSLTILAGYVGLPGDRTEDIQRDTCSQGNRAACERICRFIGGENVPGLICREHPARRGVDAGGGGNQSPSGQPGEPPRSPTPGDNPGGGGSGSSPPTVGQQIGGVVDTATQQACSVTGQLDQQIPVCP